MLKLIAILIAALAAPVLAAVPTVSVVSQTVNENAGTATVRIIRTGDLTKPSQIGFKTINGTALAGVNFTYRSGGVWFPALTNSYRFTVPILVDHKVTPDLKFAVRLTAVLNAQLLSGTITIHNTDQPPPPPPPPLPPPNPQVPSSTTLVAAQSCQSLWDTPAWEAYVAANPGSLGQLPTIVAGQTYTVTSEPGGQQAGLVPNNYTGPFVVALPVTGPSLAGAEFAPSCFPAAPANQWVSAPLRGGGFAQVSKADDWAIAGPGAGRPLVAGEIVALYTNGWGKNFDGRTTYAVHALSDGADGRAYAEDLTGVAPTGTPPTLPSGWYYGSLATANKTCPNAFYASSPGVTMGTLYRVTMVVGSWQQIPVGQPGSPGATWYAVPAANPYLGPLAVVTGDCLTGYAATP